MKIETSTIRRLRDALLQSGRRPSLVLSSAHETLARLGLLSTEEAAEVGRIEPLAEVMYLMMVADGALGASERDALTGAIRGLTDNVVRSGTVNVMLEQFEERLKEQGRDARLQEIAGELADEPSEAEGAFALAAAIALADDEVTEEENALVNQLAEWFGITAERADAILDQLEEDA